MPCSRNCSRALPCTLRAPRSPAASHLPGRTSPRTVCPPFDSRQRASAFNQPLSFDTSGVNNMAYMFYVRSSPCPAPNMQSRPLLHAASTAVARRLSRLLARSSLRTVCPPCDSPQHASAFNQPLTFDTSGVTNMGYMFNVRSSPSCPHNLQSSPLVHAACAAPAPLSSASRAAHLAPRIVHAFFSTRQAVNSLSAANKLLIRCAWAGTSAFASAGYGSSWGPGSCA